MGDIRKKGQLFATHSFSKYRCLWWVGLGVLSSVGLGTGLHTFILYLGPHIAAVSGIYNLKFSYSMLTYAFVYPFSR